MIVLTFDYEIFGSGKGCFQNDLIAPTNKILEVLDNYQVKATFFVEYLEIIKYKELAKSGLNDKNALLIPVVEKQIQEMAKAGHDIQLHIHPQWEGAEHNGKSFIMNYANWRFSSLPLEDELGQKGMKTLLAEGKAYLEELIKMVKPDYECIGFRAGGYNIGNTTKTVEALRSKGFLFDSSVYPGGYSCKSLSRYDYTGVKNSQTYWFVGETILDAFDSERQGGKLIEFPVFAVGEKRIRKLTLPRLWSFVKSYSKKKISYKSDQINRQSSKSNKEKVTINFDVCLLSKCQVIDYYQLYGGCVCKKDKNNVLTLIGHPKDYSILSPLAYLLKITNVDQYDTMSNVSRKL